MPPLLWVEKTQGRVTKRLKWLLLLLLLVVVVVVEGHSSLGMTVGLLHHQ